MKVILIKPVARLGNKGDLVEVSEGYARNYLIKNGLAKEASKKNIESIKKQEEAKERQKEALKNKKLEFLSQYKNNALEINLPANEHGHLFEKLDAKKLAQILQEKSRLEFNKSEIKMNTIKEVGEYEVELNIFGTKTKIVINVI